MDDGPNPGNLNVHSLDSGRRRERESRRSRLKHYWALYVWALHQLLENYFAAADNVASSSAAPPSYHLRTEGVVSQTHIRHCVLYSNLTRAHDADKYHCPVLP